MQSLENWNIQKVLVLDCMGDNTFASINQSYFLSKGIDVQCMGRRVCDVSECLTDEGEKGIIDI